MDERHRKVLQKCWIKLRRDLEPKKLFPSLTEVLDDSDIEDLNAISTRKDCVDALLKILPRKGPKAFKIFVEALQETQAHLAKTLQDEELGMMSEQLKDERENSAKRRNEADEAKAALRHEKKEHEVTQKKLKEITSCYEALMTENEKNKKEKSDETEDEKDKQRSKLDAKEQELAELQNLLKKQELENERVLEELEKLQKENDQLRKDFDDENKRLKQVEMMSEELTVKRASIAKRRNEADEAKAALKQEQNKLEVTQTKLEEITSRYEALMTENEKYKTEIEKINKELADEKAICEESKSEALNLKTALDEEQQKNQEIRKENVKELERKERNFEGEKRLLKHKIRDLDYQLKHQRKKSDEKMEKAKREEKSKLDKKERELTKLKDKLKRQESENGKVSGELKKLKEQLRKASDEENEKLRKTEEKVRAEAKAKADALMNELAKLKEGFGRVFTYKRDFDEGGVIYAMGTNFGALRSWVNPSSECTVGAIKVSISRSSDGRGSASDLLEHSDKRGRISCTKQEKEAWWCLELSEKYSLYLTHYTLRHGRYDGDSFLRNWRLEGSLDGQDWRLLKEHDNDSGLCEPSPYTATWPIEGEVRASRFFKIVQTKKNSSKRYGIYLSGIELYGVLIEGPIQQ